MTCSRCSSSDVAPLGDICHACLPESGPTVGVGAHVAAALGSVAVVVLLILARVSVLGVVLLVAVVGIAAVASYLSRTMRESCCECPYDCRYHGDRL